MEEQADEIRQKLELISQALRNPGQLDDGNINETIEEISLLFDELRAAEEGLQHSFDELITTREQVESERRHYQELFEFAPDAYLITDLFGNILQANSSAGRLLHLRSYLLEGKPLTVFIKSESRDTYYELLNTREALPGVELVVLPRKSPEIIVSGTVAPMFNPLGERVGLRWLLHDITQEKQALLALEASEERLQTMFHETQVGMSLTHLDGLIVDCNPAFREIIGFEMDEIQGKPFLELIHPQERAQIGDSMHRLLEGASEAGLHELRLINCDDNDIWVRFSISLLKNLQGKPQFFLFTIENISEIRHTASELAEAKRRLLESSEAEQQRLAKELHDGPMQELYGVVFKLNDVKFFSSDPAVNDNIKEAEDMVKNVASTLRGICGDLRPPVLANLGLGSAIRSHIDTRLSKTSKEFAIDLHIEIDEKRIPQEARLHLFRVYQQCLSNTIRHAQASRISVTLTIEDNRVLLLVEDDGKGFSPPKKWIDLIRQGHYGLADAAERMETINGKFEVHSAPGKGTRVEAYMPLESE